MAGRPHRPDPAPVAGAYLGGRGWDGYRPGSVQSGSVIGLSLIIVAAFSRRIKCGLSIRYAPGQDKCVLTLNQAARFCGPGI